MGKTATKNQKKQLAKARKKNALQDLESLTVSDLLAKAQEQIDTYDYDKAQKYCQEALKRDPDNVVALETSASLCLEVGNFDGAKHCLGRAITVQPLEGYSKYLSMGQLFEGKESLQLYLKGIELIQAAITKLPSLPTSENASGSSSKQSNKDAVEMTEGEQQGSSTGDIEERENEPPSSSSKSPEESQITKPSLVRQMSSVYCSIAELYMTDLCDEEDAEHQCQSKINKAIEADPSNPEAYQSMASFLLVKQEMEQAKEYITKSIELWLPKYKAVEEGEAAAGTFDPVEVCPLSYPTRLSTAKILIEVEDHDHAVDVLEGLAEEDDSVVDVWYLMGWSSYLRGEEHKDNARYLLHRAMQVHELSPSEDEQLVEHLEELIAEVGPLSEDQLQSEANLQDELDSDEDEEMDTD